MTERARRDEAQHFSKILPEPRDGGVKTSLQLRFRDFSPYNAARPALGLIIAALADDVALNCHSRRSDPQSHHQCAIGALVNAKNKKR